MQEKFDNIKKNKAQKVLPPKQVEEEDLINYLVSLDEREERIELSQRIEQGHVERQRILGSTKLGFYDYYDE